MLFSIISIPLYIHKALSCALISDKLAIFRKQNLSEMTDFSQVNSLLSPFVNTTDKNTVLNRAVKTRRFLYAKH